MATKRFDKSYKLTRDKELFKKLFNLYYTDLVLFSESILYNQDAAKDVVQELFCYLWDNYDTIRIHTNIKSYLFSSVKNRSLNRIKHLNIRDKHSSMIAEAWLYSYNLDPDEDEEKLKNIYKVASEFPTQMKRVFDLKVKEELTYDQIADEMGIGVNTVKTHLKKAFKILRDILTFTTFFLFF